MKLKKIIALVLVLALALTMFVGCGEKEQQGEQQEVKPITISFAHDKATTHNVHLRYEKWAADLNAASNGTIEIEFYPAQSLLTLAEAYEGVLNGVADIAVITPSMIPGVFPMLELFDLPCYYNNETVLSNVYWDCIQKYQPAELDKVQVLNVYCMGPGALASNKAIKNLADIKGKQIRAVGLSGACVNELGASAVSVAMPETYDALLKGVADGVLAGLGALTTWKLLEVAECVTLTPMLSCSAFLIVMNKDKWNSLTPEQQKAFTDSCDKWSPEFVLGETEEADMCLDLLASNGSTVNCIEGAEADKWMELMQPAVDKAIADRQSAGPAREWYNTMLELAKKYNDAGAQTYKEYFDAALAKAGK